MDLLPSAQLPDLETCDSEDAFAKKEMLNSFGFMLEPGAGSDLTTICNELTWKYYTFIMYPRSDNFTEANRRGLAESSTSQIDLSAEEPRLVLRMIRFLYTLVYEVSVHSPLAGLPILKDFLAIESLYTVTGCKFSYDGQRTSGMYDRNMNSEQFVR